MSVPWIEIKNRTHRESRSKQDNNVSLVLFGGLILFFLFEYVRPGSYFPVVDALKMNTIIPLVVFILTVFSRRGRPQKDVFDSASTKWFLFFLVLFPIQVLTVDVKLYVYEIFKAIVGYLLIYYVIIRQATEITKIKTIFFTLTFIHVLLVFLNPNLVLQPESRNYIAGVTFLGDGNDYAWSACIAVPMALFLAQSSEKKYIKMFHYSMAVLLVLAVIGTQSRGGSLALGVSLVYMLIRGKRKVIGLIGLSALTALVFMFAPETYFDRMSTIKNYEEEGSAKGRIMAWNSAMRMAVDHPFIGVGAGHFAVKYGIEYRPPGVGRTELPWQNAHSIYFLALGEFGFTGIIFLLGLIITNIFRIEKYLKNANSEVESKSSTIRKLATAMQASFIAFIVGGAFLSGLYYPHIFILAALMESTCMLKTSEESETENELSPSKLRGIPT